MNSADFFKSYVNDLREQQDAYMPPVGVNPILLDAFKEVGISWTVYETMGTSIINQRALSRVNFT